MDDITAPKYRDIQGINMILAMRKLQTFATAEAVSIWKSLL
jgi:hypothetical protein